MASSFSPIVTSTAKYLRNVGLDITLIQFRAYRTPGSEIVVTVSKLFPLPDIDLLRPTPSGDPDRRRGEKAVSRLVDEGGITEGTMLEFRMLTQGGEGAGDVQQWISADHSRGQARWQNHRVKPLLWQVDDKAYSPSALVAKIYAEGADGKGPTAFSGPLWWVDDQGRSIWQLAQELPST